VNVPVAEELLTVATSGSIAPLTTVVLEATNDVVVGVAGDPPALAGNQKEGGVNATRVSSSALTVHFATARKRLD
jgi:hypothetical protein